MAWTTPRTWVTGEIVTAAQLNTHVRDNLDDLHRRTTVASDYVGTSQTRTSTTYGDLTTTGPAVTVTIGSSGLVLVSLSCLISNSTASGGAAMSWAVSGATTQAASDSHSLAIINHPASFQGIFGRTTHLGGLNVGVTTFTAKYKIWASGTASFGERKLIVTPLGS